LDETTVEINTGSVSDFNNDNITYTTTLNGDPIIEASSICGCISNIVIIKIRD
jgi:hypothetical protein